MTVATISDWLERLEGVKKAGNGYKARCPAHDDRNPSLSVTEGTGGKVLVTCHAASGCTFESIRDALWPQGAATAPRAPAASKPRKLPHGPNDTISLYHDADGSIAFASVRSQAPGKAKRFSQWTPAGNGLWFDKNPLESLPLYRLPEIVGAKQVVIVEGEKCVAAVLSAWPDRAVTTYAGGCGSWRKTDWTPLAGKAVSIWADADDDAPPEKATAKSRPGQTAALEIAAHLHFLGCHVRVALPEPDGGADIADWLAVGKAHATAVLNGLLDDYEPAAGPVEADPEPPNELDWQGKFAVNDHYQVIGLVGFNVAIRIRNVGVQEFRRESLFNKNTLGAICPDRKWWSSLHDEERLTAARAFDVGSDLIMEAERKGQRDMSQVYGRGAVRLPSGQIAYHLGDRLLVKGEELPLYDPEIWWMNEAPIALAPSATDAEMKAIALAVMNYRWRSPMDGKRFLGWMVSAIVGGALEWRPHIQITAPSGQGKSWLLREVLSPLMGPLLQRIADASPAALARMTAHASLPFAFDEAEPSAQWVLELLSLMRISSGGEGQRVRVDMQTGGVQVQAPRFSALLSNVSAPDMSRADASRMVNVTLGDEVDDWNAVQGAILGAMAPAAAVRSRIIRDTPDIVAQAKAVTMEMQGRGMDSREALASAALTAGWQWWGIDPGDVASTDEHVRGRTDAADCLTALMSLPIRDPGRSAKTLAKALTDDADSLADLYAVRYDGIGGLMVRYGHRGLKEALRGTPWEKADLRSVLLQLDDATLTNPLRIGQQRGRCVNIPYATLIKAGIELEE